MTSLRTRLVVSLLAAVMIVGFTAAGFAYHRVNLRTKRLMDDQLHQIAAILGSHANGGSARPSATDDPIEVAIWGREGQLEFSTSSLLRTPSPDDQGFREALIGDESYRTFTARDEGRVIQVAQPVDAREDQAEAAAYGAFGPVAVLIPILLAIIFFVVRAVLRPVRDIASSVSRRSVYCAERIPTLGLPKEILPLVEEINRHLERQGEAVRRERDFISEAAHALRTPLAALQLQVDVLEGSTEPAQRAERLGALRAGIRRASRLSDQLLSLARIEALRQQPFGPVDLNSLIEEASEFHAPRIPDNAPRVCLSLQPGVQIKGDRRSVYLIVGNLLENALRYTPPGSSVSIVTRTEESRVRIEVMDEGSGLPEEELLKVFERFYRAANDEHGGTGLGLSTVDQLVRYLGGTVALRNRSDRPGLIAEVVLSRWTS